MALALNLAGTTFAFALSRTMAERRPEDLEPVLEQVDRRGSTVPEKDRRKASSVTMPTAGGVPGPEKDRRKATTLKVAAHLPAVLPKRQPPYTDSAGYLQRVDYT